MEIIIVLICIALILFIAYNNKKIVVTNYTIESEKISRDCKIVQLSDIHNGLFGKDNCHLLQKTKNEHPDLIVMTGDLFDRRRLNIPRDIALVHALKEIAPIVFIAGNHEVKSQLYPSMRAELEKENITILDNAKISWNDIVITGLIDTSYFGNNNRDRRLKEELSAHYEEGKFNLLLSHKPHYIDYYSSYPYDLVLCGHAHGGQFRLPFIGGLFAPGQGILPKYTSGLHTMNNTQMIISRGLGNSLFPFRLFNNPEIVSITLKNPEQKEF